ncbi:DEAD/DEAH box helicase [Clostridium botulinum C]|uniref:ATP-dependent RNA helicase DbpA n=4 Tax=Clostridium TaxID=1485 RepID=A0A9Q4TK54_CLOBO|nr:DEAD/DEAH box helicase [Clostridium botulinum]MCD3193674.1 DEAD/DEAH box helicase [Clostridium botulinum C]MCD3199742.1 DEAD/DEAH box helicase [Clostridium botulinum C]MCD3205217.1 DEAD/DEAH box helicase [Clostridium botulinum C]MCD3207143.1 DEAD/DEAH box helicase [Clostridium botulinum C]MCD3224545.1 DEAD/DEAH box helicase [Clostridium botulinum C]
MNFKEFNLSNEILKTIKMLGYKSPTEVQEKVIPIALKDKDIIVKSQTGSGKTASFGIPVCEKVLLENKKPQVLILTPTRELAVQIKEDISNIGRFKKIKCVAVYGKEPVSIQKNQLKQRVHIVVGTPGRTFDHIEKGNMELSDIRYLIIDEADKMLNMGFIDQVEDVIKRLPKDRVTMLFSATLEEKIEKLCVKYMNNPEKIEISKKNITTDIIEQEYYEVESDRKFSLLNKIIYTERPDSCIIFCNTKAEVGSIAIKMKNKGFDTKALHGGMEQKDRLEVIQEFKRGRFPFLVATDVAARGIDIEEITHVINYEVPSEKESYVHRIGRTGRAGHKGKSITLVSEYENRRFKSIEEYIGYNVPKKEIPSEEEVQEGRKLFREKNKVRPKLKKDKSHEINKKITKIHINAGKKKKIRPGDIVGAINNIPGLTSDDIGIIDVQDAFSYVDIFGDKGKVVLKSLDSIKGKKVRVQIAKK